MRQLLVQGPPPGIATNLGEADLSGPDLGGISLVSIIQMAYDDLPSAGNASRVSLDREIAQTGDSSLRCQLLGVESAFANL
jgi:hypothetical protein